MSIVRGLTGNTAILNTNTIHPPVINHFHKLGVIDGLNRAGRLVKLVENGHQHDSDDQPKQQIFRQIIQDSPRLAGWVPPLLSRKTKVFLFPMLTL
jgi:hypothetical protein